MHITKVILRETKFIPIILFILFFSPLVTIELFSQNDSTTIIQKIAEENNSFIYSPLLKNHVNANKQNSIDRNNLSEDSLNISRILWRLKTPFIKNKMSQILEEIAYEKKLIDPYPVDFYFLNPNKRERGELGNKRYVKGKTVYMPVGHILDSLSNIITRSVILRVNKIDFNSIKFDIGLLVGPNFDNSFLNLNLFPDLKDKEKLRSLLLETILKSDKKRSFEWIWGKSLENNAYYSTKLTAFNGAFTIYLEYRTYIGLNSLRDKNNWFNELPVFNPSPQTGSKDSLVLLSSDSEVLSTPIIIEKDTTQAKIIIDKSVVLEKTVPFIYENSLDTLDFNVFRYAKEIDSDRHFLKYEMELSISEIIDSLGSNITENINAIKTDKTNIKILSKSVIENKNYNETIFLLDKKISNDIYYNEKIKTILAQSYNYPMKRKTIEFIYGKSKSGYSYYALVITIFNGQITIFDNYRKNAKRDYYIDKNSWFNGLPVIK